MTRPPGRPQGAAWTAGLSPPIPSRLVRLPREFYARDTVTVARELLGKYLVRRGTGAPDSGGPAGGPAADGPAAGGPAPAMMLRPAGVRIGRIVEVEAYLGPRDLAAHTARGRTPRNQAMWGPAGHLYVYMIYGMYYCVNVVTEGGGAGTAVLLRALEPVHGIEGRTHGPGLLCKALEIDRRHDGGDLLGDTIWIAEAEDDPGRGASRPGEPARAPRGVIVRRPRIGVDYAGPWARRLLRFYLRGNRHVSRP